LTIIGHKITPTIIYASDGRFEFQFSVKMTEGLDYVDEQLAALPSCQSMEDVSEWPTSRDMLKEFWKSQVLEPHVSKFIKLF